ncbi:hypothetical protein LXL04_001771 [Taraxacum kok-saghyz]
MPNRSSYLVQHHRLLSDVGLAALSNCQNLEILHLLKTPDCTNSGITSMAENCKLLRKLHIDAGEFTALRKLCIKSCTVSDHGMEALALGCPNLVKVKVKKCKGVTSDDAGWLSQWLWWRTHRQLPVVLPSTIGNLLQEVNRTDL